MAELMRIVREWEAGRNKRGKREKTVSNFCCVKCGDHFDTRIGLAAHQGYGCDSPRIAQPTPETMSSCQECGSFAVYREKDGTVTCQTCGVRLPDFPRLPHK